MFILESRGSDQLAEEVRRHQGGDGILACPPRCAHIPYLRSKLCLTDAMEEMRDEASYCASRRSVTVHRESSTLATLPLASAKARRVSSTSGVEQQL